MKVLQAAPAAYPYRSRKKTPDAVGGKDLYICVEIRELA
jgi:hypothetical protein